MKTLLAVTIILAVSVQASDLPSFELVNYDPQPHIRAEVAV